MMDNESDYTITFRNLSNQLVGESKKFLDEFKKDNHIEGWLNRWKESVQKENGDMKQLSLELNKINPLYIPRNHQIQKAIDLAYENDFSKFLEMIEVFKNPFNENQRYAEYENSPLEDQKILKTFCGT